MNDLKNKQINAFLNVKLSVPGFFIHIVILWGLFDSLRALQMYLAIPNPPVIPFSFLMTTVMAYALIGYVYSLPLRFIRGTNQPDSKAKLIKWASVLLLPILLIPLIYGMLGVLIIYPTHIRSWLKIILAIAVIGVYVPALYVMARRLFDFILKGGISIYHVFLLEISAGLFGYMIVTSMNMGHIFIRALVAIIFIAIAILILRSRFSPIFNRPVNYLCRFVAILIILLPTILSMMPEKHPLRTKTADGQGSIILIVVEATRTDYLSAYGSKWTNTPNLDRFAQDAVVFDNFYSVGSWTLPSVGALLTGFYPTVHGGSSDTLRIHRAIPTLSENLRDEGFATGAFIVNPVIGLPSGLNKGFDTFHEFLSLDTPYHFLIPVATWKDAVFLKSCELGVTHFSGHYVAKMESKLLPWIEKHKDEKVFLYVHYFEPHIPYQPPDRLRDREFPQGDGSIDFASYKHIMELEIGMGRTPEKTMNNLKDLYAGEIDFWDERFGILLDQISKVGWDKATIIVTSDHGEEFDDHGGFDHGHSFYSELVHVPLFIKVGENIQPIPDGREKLPTDILDLSATIVDMAGATHSSYFSSMQGTSLYRTSDNTALSSPVFFEGLNRGYPNRMAVAHNGFKYIAYANDEIREVYNLNNDPHETMNLFINTPNEIIDEISGMIAEWRTGNSILRKAFRSGLDDEDEKAKTDRQLLQGLGYF